jgi:hypothetical protein
MHMATRPFGGSIDCPFTEIGARIERGTKIRGVELAYYPLFAIVLGIKISGIRVRVFEEGSRLMQHFEGQRQPVGRDGAACREFDSA